MKGFILNVVFPIAISFSAIWFMLWMSFENDKNIIKSDANTLRKLGFEVISEEYKCHAKVKDGSWRTCQYVLFAMGV